MTLLAFIVTIMVIVAIHEYGHFLTMRLFGVKVLTFSIGFGPKLVSWKSKKTGTDFMVSAIPLGGYVKPLDARDCNVSDDQRHEEFSAKPVWQRIIVYAAGPAANLLLAFVLYWLVLLQGTYGVAALVGEIKADSVAAQSGLQAGDEIIGLGEKRIETWGQLQQQLVHHVGDQYPVRVSVLRGQQTVDVMLPLQRWSDDPEQPVLQVLGIIPAQLPALLGEVTPGGRAEQAGLKAGDRILRVNDKEVSSWRQWVDVVRAHPEQRLDVLVNRGGDQHLIVLTPAATTHEGETYGQVGVALGVLKKTEHSVWSGMIAALEKVSDQIALILVSIKKMLVGDLSVKNLAGPVTIAQAAGETAAIGVVSFALFLAFFSVSLGVINLLPVPMLDGGWIAFGLVEIVQGKPLSERTLLALQSVGMVVVFSLLGLALFNDLMRQFS